MQPRGSEGREVARQECQAADAQDDRGIRERVARAHAVEERRQHAAQEERRRNAEADAESGQAQSLPHDETEQLPGRDRGLGLAAQGIAIGAWAFRSVLASVLDDVRPTDAGVLAATAATLVAVSWMASYLPARWASGVDPIVVLRDQA